MNEEDKMDVLNWIPQVKSNNISIESTNPGREDGERQRHRLRWL